MQRNGLVIGGTWDAFDPMMSLGLQGTAPKPTGSTIPGVERSAGPGLFDSAAPWWSPNNPLFWAGLVLAGAVGLIGAVTEFRVGPAGARVSLGET